MSYKLPIILLEKNIDLRFLRYLIIINNLAYTQRGNLVLNIDKLNLFDFLIKNPDILKRLLTKNNKNVTNTLIENSRIKSITTLHPNQKEYLDIRSTKSMIKYMIYTSMIIVEMQDSEPFFTLSESGEAIITGLDTEYVFKLNQLCRDVLPLRSMKTNEIRNGIDCIIKEVTYE